MISTAIIFIGGIVVGVVFTLTAIVWMLHLGVLSSGTLDTMVDRCNARREQREERS